MMIVATEGEITGFQAPLMVLSLEGTPQQLRCPIVVHADRHNTAVQEAGPPTPKRTDDDDPKGWTRRLFKLSAMGTQQ
jgi:hypothetical protein